MAQSLLDYTAPATPVPAPTGGGNVQAGRYSQATITAGAPVGTAPATGVHNTILHCVMWGGAGLLGLVLMHRAGFHLLSVGRYGGR